MYGFVRFWHGTQHGHDKHSHETGSFNRFLHRPAVRTAAMAVGLLLVLLITTLYLPEGLGPVELPYGFPVY